jgi:hypothetical protein
LLVAAKALVQLVAEGDEADGGAMTLVITVALIVAATGYPLLVWRQMMNHPVRRKRQF